jgi:hypothetical protein
MKDGKVFSNSSRHTPIKFMSSDKNERLYNAPKAQIPYCVKNAEVSPYGFAHDRPTLPQAVVSNINIKK